MSLEFTGYHCSVKTSLDNSIGSGFSAAGPVCSPAEALKNAIDDPKVSAWLIDTETMYWSKTVTIEFTIGTAMPSNREVKLPEMRNNAIGEDEYNKEVHAFVEELMALQRKYNMAYFVDTAGCAFVTRNIIPIKAISYNLGE